MRALPHVDPGTPDLRTPGRFLLWVARRQAVTTAGGVVFGVAWMGAQALVPFALGRAIDRGVARQDLAGIRTWALVLLGLGTFQALVGVMRHRFAVTAFLVGSSRLQQILGRHVAHLGADVTVHASAGDIAAASGSDVRNVARALDVIPRFVGAIVSFTAVAIILLLASPVLGAVVLVGVPLLAATIGPLVRPLENRERTQRERLGAASSLAADTVSGLRVLRGFGGEGAFLTRFREASQSVRRAGVETARYQAALEALEVALPGLFVVGVTWLGARFVIAGRISPGELVAFYAYTAFLVVPLKTFTEAARKYAAATVSAGRLCRLLNQQRRIADPVQPAVLPPPGAALADAHSGLVVEPGRFTAIAATSPESATALVDRLGRYVEDGVTLGGVALRDLRVDDVRARVVVSDAAPVLLSGTVRDNLDVPSLGGSLTEQEVLDAASAWDVVDSVDGGLDGELPERGRSLSGGQRQRLA
ncbi:MAG: ABC transporter ATP-binding protein/permease, partial [Frankia sp.]|nr:ABC transporter ATP-binding protein/permease [Frankia sp.]